MWAVTFFFKKPEKTNLWIVAMKVFGSLTILIDFCVTLFSDDIFFMNGVIGLVFLTLSFILFWASIYSNKKDPLAFAFARFGNDHVVTHGPYKYIRHPFYLSYTLAWIGSFISSFHPATLPPIFVMGFLYIRAAVAEERGFENSSLRESYSAYKGKTHMFFPRWSK